MWQGSQRQLVSEDPEGDTLAKDRPTLRLQDVAEAAGVSIATASRSLSRTAGVSEEVAERVRGVARDMGYVANVHARSLAGGHPGRSGCWSTRSATPTSPRSPAACCAWEPGRD